MKVKYDKNHPNKLKPPIRHAETMIGFLVLIWGELRKERKAGRKKQ
jgi:hypothetical protein